MVVRLHYIREERESVDNRNSKLYSTVVVNQSWATTVYELITKQVDNVFLSIRSKRIVGISGKRICTVKSVVTRLNC